MAKGWGLGKDESSLSGVGDKQSTYKLVQQKLTSCPLLLLVLNLLKL